VSTATVLVYGVEICEPLGAIVAELRKANIALYCEGGPSPHGPNITPVLLEFPSTAPPRSLRKDLTPEDPWGFIFTRFSLHSLFSHSSRKLMNVFPFSQRHHRVSKSVRYTAF